MSSYGLFTWFDWIRRRHFAFILDFALRKAKPWLMVKAYVSQAALCLDPPCARGLPGPLRTKDTAPALQALILS